MSIDSKLNFNAIISGVGKSAIGRPLDRSPMDLTLDAVLAAVEKAGLTVADIDGIATWPGFQKEPAGFSPVSIRDIKEALRLQLNWYCGGLEQSGQFSAIANACAAVSTGLAKHVVVFRTIAESSAQAAMRKSPPKMTAPPKADSNYQWQLPFDALSTVNWVALYAQRHFHDYGTTREQLAQIALNARRNAALNPDALFRDPLTMEDYLQARMISSPLCLYDCDTNADASTAIIVSAAETAPDLKCRPIKIESVGTALHGRESWDQFEDLASVSAMESAARMMWAKTDLTPKDVDVAQLYDGFSYFTLAWLEALGFCGKGESGSFVEGGHRIALDGELPLNTDGGQLAAGKRHGFGFLHEACMQLWGECGERQVSPQPKTAVVAVGGGPQSTCLLLSAG